MADKFAAHGTNFWYDATPAQILEGITLPAGWPAPATLTTGRDTLDVWIDSGSSHAAVLKRGQGGSGPPISTLKAVINTAAGFNHRSGRA